MAFANYFYHGQTRRYVAMFGSLFNEITIERQEEAGQPVKKFIVPINYGPWQKFLTKKDQDLDRGVPVAMALPRIAFEIVGMNYAPTRKLPSVNKIRIGETNMVYSPTPYDIEITLSVMTKYIEDLYKIKEQIIPFFAPEYCPSVYMIDGADPIDVPINLNSVAIDDTYEGDYETRRAIIGTFSFTIQAQFYGPVREAKPIKFIKIDFNDEDAVVEMQLVDKNDPDKPYQEVVETDDWDIETTITEKGDPDPAAATDETTP